MNKKYLLRGIGIGIIIGVSIMFAAWKSDGSTSGSKPDATETVTQAPTEELTEAATEATTEKKTESTTEATTEKKTEATTEATTEKKTEATTEATTEKKTEATTEATTEKATEEKTEEKTEAKKDDKLTVEITSGMGSEDVSAALQENGIIDNADEFNEFLINNGYDAQLRVGSFSFKAGDSFENLAKVLTTEGE